jgi:hypothetical protein
LDHGTATAEAIIAAIKRYAATKPDPEYTPAPARWLNEARWLDDGASPGAPPGLWWQNPKAVEALTRERWLDGIGKHANGTWPVDKLGPPPGHAECIVPTELIRELNLTELYTPAGMKRGKYS